MAYLTTDEYVTRFGARETGLLTNTDAAQGAGQASYDAAKVETALQDATDEIEGYVSRRYAVPLESPPTIVKGWVAAIARLKLAEATGRVADAIQAAADRVTRQLEQLAASKLDLPIEPGQPALPENDAGSPMTSNDRDCPTFTRCAMDDFTSPFTMGGCDSVPNWRRG